MKGKTAVRGDYNGVLSQDNRKNTEYHGKEARI
jgi:hypothetical protein